MDVSQDAVPPLGPVTKHFWLLSRMAKATGVNLVAAFEQDALTSQEWADLVTHCRGCTWVEGCGRFLNQPETDSRPLPERCKNAATLTKIKNTLKLKETGR